jgi:hypothetical protein
MRASLLSPSNAREESSDPHGLFLPRGFTLFTGVPENFPLMSFVLGKQFANLALLYRVLPVKRLA